MLYILYNTIAISVYTNKQAREHQNKHFYSSEKDILSLTTLTICLFFPLKHARAQKERKEQIYNDNDDGTFKCLYIRQESKLKDISLI